MPGRPSWPRLSIALVCGLFGGGLLVPRAACGQEAFGSVYSIGAPVLAEVWVDPVHGNDANSGSSSNQALRTINEAWGRLPTPAVLTGTGYRVWLMAGDCEAADIPSWWESRHGSRDCPIIFTGIPQGAKPDRNPAVFRRNSRHHGESTLRISGHFHRRCRLRLLGDLGCPTALDKSREKGLFRSPQIPEAAPGCPIARQERE